LFQNEFLAKESSVYNAAVVFSDHRRIETRGFISCSNSISPANFWQLPFATLSTRFSFKGASLLFIPGPKGDLLTGHELSVITPPAANNSSVRSGFSA